MADHEYFTIVPIKKHKKYILGEELYSRVFIDETPAEEDTSINQYLHKLDFNTGIESNNFIIDFLANQHDTLNLFNYLKNLDFYKQIDDFTLYIYCRKLSKRPISKQEIRLIHRNIRKLEAEVAKDPDKKYIKKQKTILHF